MLRLCKCNYLYLNYYESCVFVGSFFGWQILPHVQLPQISSQLQHLKCDTSTIIAFSCMVKIKQALLSWEGGRLNGKYMQALFWLFHSYTINSTWGVISMCVLFVLFSSHRGHRGQQCCCGDCCSGDKHHCICCWSPGWSSDVPLHQQAPFTVQT